MFEDVAEIQDDFRLGRIRDGYTGKHYASVSDLPAESLTPKRSTYIVQWVQSRNMHCRGVKLYEKRVFPSGPPVTREDAYEAGVD